MEAESKCGDIEKIHVFRNNPDGVVSIKFKVLNLQSLELYCHESFAFVEH